MISTKRFIIGNRFYVASLILFFTMSFNGQTDREIFTLDKNWRFHKGDVDSAYRESFNDSNWENVTVPHDWAIKGPFNKEIDKQKVGIVQNGEKVATEKTGRTGALPYIGVGWYRTKFSVPDLSEEKKVLLLFEGAMSEPDIFLNGEKVGRWNYG